MPTYTGPQQSRPTFATQDGGAWMDSNNVAIPANLTTADVIVLMDVPAGVRLETLRWRSTDLDGGTTLAMNIGYRTKLPGGTQTVLTAFASASTAFQAATTTWQELTFAPIKFNEPVQLVAIPSANATSLPAAGTVFGQATGVFEGIT